jgi:hypothetical protein
MVTWVLFVGGAIGVAVVVWLSIRSPRLRPLGPIVIAAGLVLFAAWIGVTGAKPDWVKAYSSDEADALAESLLTVAGWLLALAGLLAAGRSALRGLTFNAVSKLHDDEADPAQAEAKATLRAAARPKGSESNPYSHVREHVRKLKETETDSKRLDEARRRLTHFWYRAARLVDLGVLTLDDVIESVGPPDIIEILEPLEAITAENIDPDWKAHPWPPMKLFIAWQKKRGHSADVRQWQAQVPARSDLYELSKPQIATTTLEPSQPREGAQT